MTSKDQIIIKWLEKDFISSQELTKVKIKDNHEPLTDLHKFDPTIILKPCLHNIPYTGKTIFVRLSVAKKLKKINQRLIRKKLCLKITDGYRPYIIQKKYWCDLLNSNQKKYPHLTRKVIEDLTDQFVAKPSVACHPTGGAVDLTIINHKTKKELFMGTKLDLVHYKSYSFYPFLSTMALFNRRLLFTEMAREKFFNVHSEWWHFSYGTIDWALYFNKKTAIYNVIKQ